MFNITINGIYPKHPEPPRPRPLEKVLDDYELNLIEDKVLEKALERAVVDAVGEMIAGGVEMVSDGLIRRYEPNVCIFSRLSGTQITSNQQHNGSRSVSVRVTDKIRWKEPLAVNEYSFIAERSPVSVRPVLTGPFSLLENCDLGVYAERPTSLVTDISIALNKELRELKKAGAEWILIEEPNLHNFKEDTEFILETYSILLDGVFPSIMLGTHCEDIAFLVDILPKTQWNGIAINLVNSNANYDLIQKNLIQRDLTIQLGLIDAECEVIEDASLIAEKLLFLSQFHDPNRLWIAPNKGFAVLNRDVIYKKLLVMSSAVNIARKESARQEQPGGELTDDKDQDDVGPEV